LVGGGVESVGGGVVSTGGGVVVSGGGVVVVSGGGDSLDSSEEPLLHATGMSDTNSRLPSSRIDLHARENTCPSTGLTAAPHH